MADFKKFIAVFLAEADYAGFSIAGLEVTELNSGVYGFDAVFKDGAKAHVRGRVDVFSGTNYQARFELMQRLMDAKGPAPIVKKAPEDALPKAADSARKGIVAKAKDAGKKATGKKAK